jgi:FMN reductase
MILVFSTSLHPDSRSRLLANVAAGRLNALDQTNELIDLATLELPACNGHDCYSQPLVGQLAHKIAAARGILIATPIYNYDVSSTAKNLIELTGSAWNDKVVGLLCSAGGKGSLMAPMGFANSLMLDFRCLILPQYVFADETAFENGEIVESSIGTRIHALVSQLISVSGHYPG